MQPGVNHAQKLISYPPTEIAGQKQELPWHLHFKEMAPRLLRKTFLGHKGNERPTSFSKGFIYISKQWDSTYSCKFPKINALWKTKGEEVSLLIFNRDKSLICNFLHLGILYPPRTLSLFLKIKNWSGSCS